MDYRQEYDKWCNDPYFDEQTREELKAIAGDDKEIEDRFYRTLEFGTAGLRGVIGAGTNRMNIYTVRQATQGLANYILAQGGQEKGVAIAHDSRLMADEFTDAARFVLQQTESKHMCSRVCVRFRNFHLLSGHSDVLQVLLLPQAITRENITDIKYTGKTVHR